MISDHRQKAWFVRAKEAHDRGIDNIHLFNSKYLSSHYKSFHEKNLHKIQPYDKDYVPNPFRYQYDLCMFCWLNFEKIIKGEVKALRFLAKNNKNLDDIADEILSTNTLYGITRADFLFIAAELRWPTTILESGAHHGLFIRDPWSEKRVAAISNNEIHQVVSFGGGGQGKTHVSIGVALMIFDYFLLTMKGARAMISTVNKDKMNSVSWAYLCNLNSTTAEGISLTAGKSKPGGEWTLRRPGNRDSGGVFKGILIGDKMNTQTIVDKLTGSHGHPFIIYIMDEMQSTPNPPIIAAPNYTMHAGGYKILCSGNWGENHDTLANNIKPDIGWKNVDENTGEWIATTENGSKAIVLHFNNNNSPGMTKEGNKMFPHLPSQKILDAKYPPVKRTMSNLAYRRFWVGFRTEGLGDATVINEHIVREGLADQPLVLRRLDHSFFTFDSAPAESDRNIDIIWNEGICNVTGQRVFGPKAIHLLEKSTESLKYYQESSNQLMDLARKNNIKSGAGVVDWTGRPAHPEKLKEMGFLVHKLVYNKSVPDGVRRDIHTNRVEREIRLNIELDFKQDLAKEKVCAHHVCENVISLGAWAFREYVKAGRVRGISPDLFKGFERSMEEELYYRKFEYKNSTKYGKRFHLEEKTKFKKDFGFSPDILDCFFEAGWYMLTVRRLPLTPIDSGVNFDEQEYDEHEDHSELWESDLIATDMAVNYSEDW